MAARLDITSADSVLKEYYDNQRVVDMTYQDAPLYALLPKYKNFEGKSYPLPVKVTNSQGRSATFATAKANKQASVYKDFSLTRVRDYSLASIDTETILASRSNPGAFLRLATAFIDDAMESLARSLSFSAYGDGTGWIGQVNVEPTTSASTFVVTLKQAEDVAKFEVGQTLVIYSATSGGAKRTSDGSDDEWVIAGVDRSAGTLTLTGSYDASGDIDADDYIFVEGDRGARMSGLAAWIPSSAPSATEFFGVNRTVDATRLGGNRIDCSSMPMDEALIHAARRIAAQGGAPDYCFVDFTRYANLEKTLQSRVQYTEAKPSDANISFTGIKVSGPRGPITVLPDRDCPADKAYMLTMKHCGLYSLGEPVMLIDLDSNKMLRESDADGYEVRVASYHQMGIELPGACGVLTF